RQQALAVSPQPDAAIQGVSAEVVDVDCIEAWRAQLARGEAALDRDLASLHTSDDRALGACRNLACVQVHHVFGLRVDGVYEGRLVCLAALKFGFKIAGYHAAGAAVVVANLVDGELALV